MIEKYFKSIRDEKFNEIDEFRAGSWLHVDEANIKDLQTIKEITGLELSDLKDSLDKYEVPRVEQRDKNIIIFVRYPSEEEIGMHTSTLAIILTPSYLITISPQQSSLVDMIVSSRTKLATTQKSKLLLYLLLKITQGFTLKIKNVRHTVIEHEQKMKNINNDAIVALTKNEDTLNQYLSTLVPLRNVLETIASGRYVNLYEKDQDLLQDLLIAIKQSEDLCRVNIKNIRSLRDSYQILFTNNVNKTMKLLTAITIIFTIPTIISSIYGMNVKLPLASNPYAFLIIMNITVIITLVCLFLFIRKKWI
jgi:magnesium transporter